MISAQTKNEINEYLESLIPAVISSVNRLSIDEIINHKNPLIREMFQNQPEEFITFFVMERVERSFVTHMGKVIEYIV